MEAAPCPCKEHTLTSVHKKDVYQLYARRSPITLCQIMRLFSDDLADPINLLQSGAAVTVMCGGHSL